MLRCAHFLALLILALLPTGGSLAQVSAPEYQLKALFLFNFTQFVEWPPEALASPDAPLVICVLGQDPFGAYLDDAVRDERVRGHPLRAKRALRLQEVDGCHVLFVSGSESDQFKRILSYVKGRSILTVGDRDGFVSAGGVIRLVTIDNKIRLRINPEAARAANLVISSKLLRPAQMVAED
jgi:YfiR/HmsC-like